MRGRGIVYIILIGILTIMAYWGIRLGVKLLIALSIGGMVVLIYNYFARPEE